MASNRSARYVLEECIKWAVQRKVFGKALIEQPVIRFKIGTMAARIEADHALLEKITDQMNKMSYAEMSEHLAGPIALLKYECTRTCTLVADEAVQIFGGRGLTKTGMGRNVEMFNRTYKACSTIFSFRWFPFPDLTLSFSSKSLTRFSVDRRRSSVTSPCAKP